MTDYSTDVNLSRDDMVRMLTDDYEQLCYVLTGVVSDVIENDGTVYLDDFFDSFEQLNDDERDKWRAFIAYASWRVG